MAREKQKFLFCLEVNSFSNTFFCCFGVESVFKLIAWIGLILNLVDLSNSTFNELPNLIFCIVRVSLYIILIVGYKNENLEYLNFGYKFYTLKYIATNLVILSVLIILSFVKNDIEFFKNHSKNNLLMMITYSGSMLAQQFLYYTLLIFGWTYLIIDGYLLYAILCYINWVEIKKNTVRIVDEESLRLADSNNINAPSERRYFDNEEDYLNNNHLNRNNN